MDPVERYLRELRDLRSSGEAVDETSYYPALSNLLNSLGATLKPTVKAILPIKNRGAGIPDGGFFTADQLRRSRSDASATQVPSRGVLEAKPTTTDLDRLAQSQQIAKYAARYRLVLLTNYREFLVVSAERDRVTPLEHLSLAADDWSFWRATRDPQEFARQQSERLREYLKRVMTRQAPLVSPHDLSTLMASYAREARLRIEEADLPALNIVRSSLEQALGVHFTSPKGEHFFRSTLVQTLFYGLFSAWVLWVKTAKERPERFNWHEAAWSLKLPMIRALFEQVATPSRLGPLNLVEVLDWTADALNRVDRAAFFEKFDESHAVQYFYEPFLRAFDPTLRKELGVWYTPDEIVRYMVRRVERVLRDELGIADAFADPRVYVLDPACGTGAFVIEVLRRIEKTLRAKRNDALLANDVKEAAKARVFGFEILPAPLVISHLQVGLFLQNLGAPLAPEERERAAVYLTNALTGWQPPSETVKASLEQLTLNFPELSDERDAAERVKRDAPILVVLGNPPYNGFAGASPDEEEGLLDAYKAGRKRWGITKNKLDDLYVRFFRVAERRIAEHSHRGVVCFISNHSFVTDPTYVVVREHLLKSFDRIWIDGLHGDRKNSEYAPDGHTSETIFATTGFSAGIQQGVAISTLVKRTPLSTGNAEVFFRDDFDAARAGDRRQQLLDSLDRAEGGYERVTPSEDNLFSFRRFVRGASFTSWPTVAELAASEPTLGLNENRHQALIDTDRSKLAERMRSYYDAKLNLADLRGVHPGLVTDAAGFDASATRLRLLAESRFNSESIHQIVFRPFDVRWCYVERAGNLWNRVRPELVDQSWDGNEFLYARRNAPKPEDGAPMYFSSTIADQHALHKDAYLIPILLKRTSSRKSQKQGGLFGTEAQVEANLSADAKNYLHELGLDSQSVNVARSIWFHALAISYSPYYLTENADAVRQGWPRVPLPGNATMFEQSARWGEIVASLLDQSKPTSAAMLSLVAVVATDGVDGQVRPERGDLSIRAGWGYKGKGGTNMPAVGRTRLRQYGASERADIIRAGATAGLSESQSTSQLGQETLDVFANDEVHWRNVPIRVWEYTIGGYQVLKKWLSYREEDLLGRPLSKEEARQFTDIASRIASLLLLEPALDANYRKVAVDAYVWRQAPEEAARE